jgi:hypothetical protein
MVETGVKIMPLLDLIPEEAITGMYVCARRFDGYKYETECLGDLGGRGLEKLTVPMRESLIFHRDTNINLAAFFWTQRRLKEDEKTIDSRDHVLFDMLFIHLYKTEIPTQYRDEKLCLEWSREHQDEAEIIAALTRESFTKRPRIGLLFND